MKKTNLVRFHLSLLFAMVSLGDLTQVLACRMSREGKQNFFINPELQVSGIFSDAQRRPANPSLVDRCQPNAGKFMMISTGIRVPSANSDTADISFDGTLLENACSIKNSLSFLGPQSFSEKKANFDNRYHFLRKCTHIQVYDTEKSKIQFNPNQRACKITSLGEGILRLDGEYCFLKIHPSNRFAVQIVINDECKTDATLTSHEIYYQDIEGVINTYVVGDDSGLSTDIDPLGSNRFRIFIQPPSRLFPLSEAFDQETPRFVTTYAPDLNLGPVKIRGQNNIWFLSLGLEANNRNPKNCISKACNQISNFSVPVVGEVELFRKAKDRFNSIDNWWFAALLEPNYQGILRNAERNIMDLGILENDEFKLTVTFVDPYEDFNLFVSQIQQFLIDLKSVNGTAGIDVIQPINPLAQLIGLRYLDGLPNLRSPDMAEELGRVIDSLNRLGLHRQWPSYFSKVCNSSLSTCVNAGRSRFYLRLSLEFQIGEGTSASGHLNLKNLRVRRESAVDKSFYKPVMALPEVSCD